MLVNLKDKAEQLEHDDIVSIQAVSHGQKMA